MKDIDPAPSGPPDGTPRPTGPRRPDYRWAAAGIVIMGVSLFLAIQALNGNDTSLLGGPMGQALNIGGVIAGAWVFVNAWKR